MALISFQSIARGGSVTIPSGSNRLVVLTIGAYSWVANAVSGWSLGGATLANGGMILAKRQQYETGGNHYTSEIYYVKESDIDAGSITLGDPTWTATARELPTFCGVYTFGDCDQTSAIDTTAGLGGTSQDSEIGTAAVADSTEQVIHIVTNASAASATTIYGDGWTEDQDVAGTPGTNGTTRHIDGSKATTTGATIDYGADDTASVRHCIAMASFLPASAKVVKLLAHSGAASATGIEGVVLNAARDTVIGEFSGQAFEASLESGEAVLLIPVEAITPDGNTLTTSDTPIVFAYNATDSIIGPGSATVIEV